MKGLLFLFLILPLTNISTVPELQEEQPQTWLGANYNEFFEQVDHFELKKTNTKWVRGFFDFFELYHDYSLANNKRVNAYLGLKKAGYQTVVNLKFNFKI